MNNSNFPLGIPDWASACDLEAIDRIAKNEKMVISTDEVEKNNQIEMDEVIMAEKQFESEELVDNVMDDDTTWETVFEDSMSPIPSPTSHVVQSFGGLELCSVPQTPPPPTPEMVTSDPLTLEEFCQADNITTTRFSSRISSRRSSTRRSECQSSVSSENCPTTKTPRYRLKKKELKAMAPDKRIDHIRHQNLKNSANYRQRQREEFAEKERIVERLEAELKKAEAESLEMEDQYTERFKTQSDLKARIFEGILKKRQKKRAELEGYKNFHERELQEISERRCQIKDRQDLKDHQKKRELSTNGSQKSREMGYLRSSEMDLEAYELSTSLEQHSAYKKKLEQMFGKISNRTGAKYQPIDPPQGEHDFTTGCNTGAASGAMHTQKRTGRRSVDLMAAHTTRGRAVSDSLATHPADVKVSGAQGIRRNSACLDEIDRYKARPDTKRLKELESYEDHRDVMTGDSAESASLALGSGGGMLSGCLNLASSPLCDRRHHEMSFHFAPTLGDESTLGVYLTNHGAQAIRERNVCYDANDEAGVHKYQGDLGDVILREAIGTNEIGPVASHPADVKVSGAHANFVFLDDNNRYRAGQDAKRLNELKSSEDHQDVMAGSYSMESATRHYSLKSGAQAIRGTKVGYDAPDRAGIHNYRGDRGYIILTQATGPYKGNRRDVMAYYDAPDRAGIDNYRGYRGDIIPTQATEPYYFGSVASSPTYPAAPVFNVNINKPLVATLPPDSQSSTIARCEIGTDGNGPLVTNLKAAHHLVSTRYPFVSDASHWNAPNHGARAIRGEMVGHNGHDGAGVHNYLGNRGDIIHTDATGPDNIGSFASSPPYPAAHVFNVNFAKTLTTTASPDPQYSTIVRCETGTDENDPIVTNVNAAHHLVRTDASHSNALAFEAGAGDTKPVGHNKGGSYDILHNSAHGATGNNENYFDDEDVIESHAIRGSGDVTTRNGGSRRNVLAVGSRVLGSNQFKVDRSFCSVEHQSILREAITVHSGEHDAMGTHVDSPNSNIRYPSDASHCNALAFMVGAGDTESVGRNKGGSRRDTGATGQNENDPLASIPIRPAGADVGSRGTALSAYPAGIRMSPAYGVHGYNGASYRTSTESDAAGRPAGAPADWSA